MSMTSSSTNQIKEFLHLTHGFLYWWPGHHDEKLGLQLFLTDGRFECDWHIWILLGNQFANYIQKTGPKSDIFYGFWSVFRLDFEKCGHIWSFINHIFVSHSRILSHRSSKISFFINFWKGSQNP